MRFVNEAEADDAGFPLASFLDVVLLLLIFFVVTSSFVEREITIELPEVEASGAPAEPRVMVLELTAEGTLVQEGEEVTLDRLRARFDSGELDPAQPFEIRADEAVAHGRVAELLGLLQAREVETVGIAVAPLPAVQPAGSQSTAPD